MYKQIKNKLKKLGIFEKLLYLTAFIIAVGGVLLSWAGCPFGWYLLICACIGAWVSYSVDKGN